MRYEIDPNLKAEYEHKLKMLLANLPTGEDTTTKDLRWLAEQYFQIGFGCGVRACGVYSDHIKQLHDEVEAPKPWIDL